MSKKGRTEADGGCQNLRPGAPDIAHPVEVKKWERQTTFVTGWFVEMLERIDGIDEVGARGARDELQALLRNSVSVLLRCAKKATRSTAREWAGQLLANIYSNVGKNDGKLSATNAAYRQEKEKFAGKSLSSALFPKEGVCRITQEELLKARRYHWFLGLLKEALGGGWEAAAEGQRIPKEYWPLVEFPEFSTASLHEWSVFLWPLIAKKIDLSKMPPLKLREYDTVKVSMRNGKAEMRDSEKKIRKRYLSDSETTAHDHLKLLARLSDAGIF